MIESFECLTEGHRNKRAVGCQLKSVCPSITQPIYHSEFPALRTSINTTLKGHTFHPGTVTHSVNFRGGVLYYDVSGAGEGGWPAFNNAAGILIFKPGVVDVVNNFGR